MGCNCGKSRAKVAMTSAEATALMQAPPKYKVTSPAGAETMHDTYVAAKTEQVHNGGTLTEVREV